MAKKQTVFQTLTSFFRDDTTKKNISTYNINTSDSDVLFSTYDKDERDRKLATMKQQRLLAYQWAKTGYEASMEQLNSVSTVAIMYRDADLMDTWPEIGCALDILSEESTVVNSKGKMLNIYSKSERIASVLEDLFVNKLNINVMLPMIARSMYKYGNEFMYLNISEKDGVIGWRELPVYHVRRLENGMSALNGGLTINNYNPDDVKFVWEGHNDAQPFKKWQIAHFRLINDSLMLPYGVSHLNKARRHWRMMSMMEDAMLLYRLERSVERRIFKVNVGGIDDADVPAFLNEFMNNVKRAPVIDSKTGQMDLKKNYLDVSADYVIPVRPGMDPTDISTLQGAQNQTSMDDINYMENKVLSALKVPKSFLNFQDKDSKNQNMANIDIRFSRAINKGQQALLLELNKIAIIHLMALGFEDDLTNFTLSLNNPSNQMEILELENLNNRIGAASSALNEQGGGIPLMSWHMVQKEIMGKSDNEIYEMLKEIRLESAMAIELEKTSEIIKRTGLFNNVDRIYGEPGAEYSDDSQDGEDGGFGGGGFGGGDFGGGGGLGDFGGGDDLGDLGEPGASEDGEISGNEESIPLEDMPMEGSKTNKPLINEKSGFDVYMEYIKKLSEEEKSASIINKVSIINENLNSDINSFLNDNFKE